MSSKAKSATQTRVSFSVKPSRRTRSPATSPSSGSEVEDDDFSHSDAASSSGDEMSSGDSDADDIRQANRLKHGKRAVVALPTDDQGVEELGVVASEKTKKRKRRATSPTSFGASLTAVLEQPKQGPSLSIPRYATPRTSTSTPSHKLAKQISQSKHALLEKGHITDIHAGWTARPCIPFSDWLRPPPLEITFQEPGGQAKEKWLRRTAQKGVVRLFNAIKAAQNVVEDEVERRQESGAKRRKLVREAVNKREAARAGQPVPASAPPQSSEAAANGESAVVERVGKKASNVLGSRGKDEALANLSKATFLQLIKSGTA